MPRRPPRSPAAGAACLGAGFLTALALPPWGWWPLALVGVALLDLLLADLPARRRFARGALFTLAWLGMGLGWMWFLSAPGYLLVVPMFGCWIGGACALAPPGRWRMVGLPAAFVLLEAVRFSFPFGGVPLASLAIGQADGPLAPVVRLGGALLLTGVVVLAGCGLAAVVRRRPAGAAAALGTVAVVAVAGYVAPYGHDIAALRVTAVQGGGEQGTHAIDTDPRLVFDRHVEASAAVPAGQDLVLWPENIVDPYVVDPETGRRKDAFLDGTDEDMIMRDLARRFDAVFAVGVTETSRRDPNRFTNYQLAYDRTGEPIARYDKVRRVPFGEYMPMRGLLHALGAPTDLVPRDAVSGTGPAVLRTPVGTLGVVISWEVFFGGRARDAIGHGGEVLLNPTNGSSYTGTVLQTQQVASSRLRALETGRWVVQCSPTGFSGFVDPQGRMHDRTAQRERKVLTRTVERRAGMTLYTRIGDRPIVAIAVLALVLAQVLAVRTHRRVRLVPAPGEASGPDPDGPAWSDLEQDGDRAVVDELDGHVGAEPSGGDGCSEAT